MRKLLAIPNDPSEKYKDYLEKEFFGEFNPLTEKGKFFDEVKFLNWRDSSEIEIRGIKSIPFLKNKEKISKLYNKLSSYEIPFDSEENSFKELFLEEKNVLKRTIKEFNPSLIRGFNTHFATELGFLLKEISNKPLIVSAHDPTRLTEYLRNVDHLICESQELRNISAEKFGINPRKISVIPQGIDLNFFYPRSKERILETFDKDFVDSPYKTLSSGKISKNKNLETILKALSMAKFEISGLKHIHLGENGENKEKIKETIYLAKKLGLEENFFYLEEGNKEENSRYYSWADLFLSPVLWEGLGMKLRESLACGTPAIASNYGSQTEIIQDRYNGLNVDPINPEEIAEATIYFLKNNKLRKRLEKNSRQSVEKYRIEISMEKLNKVYEKMLK